MKNKTNALGGDAVKRATGAFLTIFEGREYLWIDEEKHLEKPTEAQKKHWSWRDEDEWRNERADFIRRAERYELDGCTYVVVWNCEITEKQKQKVVYMYHNKLTERVDFND